MGVPQFIFSSSASLSLAALRSLVLYTLRAHANARPFTHQHIHDSTYRQLPEGRFLCVPVKVCVCIGESVGVARVCDTRYGLGLRARLILGGIYATITTLRISRSIPFQRAPDLLTPPHAFPSHHPQAHSLNASFDFSPPSSVPLPFPPPPPPTQFVLEDPCNCALVTFLSGYLLFISYSAAVISQGCGIFIPSVP